MRQAGRAWSRVLLIGLGLIGLCPPAHASDLTSLVFFGDSLTDEGRAGRTAPLMWSQVLRNDLSVTNGTNFAIGGAITSNQPSDTFGDSSYLGQINSFIAAGGAQTSKTGAGIWIGTNNIWIGASRGFSPTAVATAAAQDVTKGITQLTGAGVSSISLLGVYDLSLTNAYMLAGTDSMAVRNSAAVSSALFNTLLQNAAASRTNVTFYNIANFLNYLQMHPAAFGLTNVLPLQPGQSCDATCQQTSLFSDTIHLSARAQQLIGDYVASGVATYNNVNFIYGAIAGNIYSATTTLPMASYLARSVGSEVVQSTFGRLDAFQSPTRSALVPLSGDGVRPGPWSIFGTMNATTSMTTGTGLAADINQTIVGLTTGVDYSGIPGLHVGGLLNYAHSDADLTATAAGRTRLDAFTLAGYAALISGNGFIEALAGVGYDAFDQRRTGSFGQISARPEGMTYLAAARVGQLFDIGPVQIGPVLGLSYVASHVLGYSEDGAASYRLVVGAQDARSLTGSIGYQVRASKAMSWPVDPVLTVTYEREFLGDATTFATSYAYLPTQSLATRTIAGQDAVRAALGLTYAPSGALSLAFNGFGLVTTSRSYSLGGDLKLSYRY